MFLKLICSSHDHWYPILWTSVRNASITSMSVKGISQCVQEVRDSNRDANLRPHPRGMWTLSLEKISLPFSFLHIILIIVLTWYVSQLTIICNCMLYYLQLLHYNLSFFPSSCNIWGLIHLTIVLLYRWNSKGDSCGHSSITE